jgi:hypothetical protein
MPLQQSQQFDLRRFGIGRTDQLRLALDCQSAVRRVHETREVRHGSDGSDSDGAIARGHWLFLTVSMTNDVFRRIDIKGVYFGGRSDVG